MADNVRVRRPIFRNFRDFFNKKANQLKCYKITKFACIFPKTGQNMYFNVNFLVFEKKMQNLPIFPVFSRFSRFPRLSRFCADFGGGLKKNGISCSKDDYLSINYIILGLI